MPVNCPGCARTLDPIMLGDDGFCVHCRLNRKEKLVAAGVYCPACGARPIAVAFLCTWCAEIAANGLREDARRQHALRTKITAIENKLAHRQHWNKKGKHRRDYRDQLRYRLKILREELR